MEVAIPTAPPSSCTQSRSSCAQRRRIASWQGLHQAIALLGVETALGKQAPHVLRLRGRLAPVTGRDPGQGKMESRGISATLRQGSSCRPPDEFVFGASAALRLTLRGRPTRRLGSTAPTLAASSTPSLLNAFCLVLFDSSDWLSKALPGKVNWCLRFA